MRKGQGQTGRGGEAALSMTEGEGLMDKQLMGKADPLARVLMGS